MEQQGPDFIVTSLLTELKDENNRKDKLIHDLMRVICGFILSLVAVVAGFLWYLNQYDFTSTETITASGIYTLIDSEGNVIAQDISPEEIMEVLENGGNTENSNSKED